MVTEYYNTCFVLRGRDGSLFLTDGGGGGGIMAQFRRAGLDWRDLKGMFVTHCHCDHLLGAVWAVRKLASMLLRKEREDGMSIYALPEVAENLRTICSLTLGPKENSVIAGRCASKPCATEKHIPWPGARSPSLISIRSRPRNSVFPPAWRPENRFVCLGDEPFDKRCAPYAQGADWLAGEAYCLDSMRGIFQPEKIRHSTVKETAENAERLGAKNLILWHTEDRATFGRRKELFTREARQYYSGNVVVPDDLESIAL